MKHINENDRVCFFLSRMLLPPPDLNAFNNMVTPVEVEAYDILKYRSSA